MKQTADENLYILHLKIVDTFARRPHDHCAIALGLPQDDRSMSVRFYEPCMGHRSATLRVP